MSAQIIAALYKRADELDSEVEDMKVNPNHPRAEVGWYIPQAIAIEFRRLAQEAEGLK